MLFSFFGKVVLNLRKLVIMQSQVRTINQPIKSSLFTLIEGLLPHRHTPAQLKAISEDHDQEIPHSLFLSFLLRGFLPALKKYNQSHAGYKKLYQAESEPEPKSEAYKKYVFFEKLADFIKNTDNADDFDKFKSFFSKDGDENFTWNLEIFFNQKGFLDQFQIKVPNQLGLSLDSDTFQTLMINAIKTFLQYDDSLPAQYAAMLWLIQCEILDPNSNQVEVVLSDLKQLIERLKPLIKECFSIHEENKNGNDEHVIQQRQEKRSILIKRLSALKIDYPEQAGLFDVLYLFSIDRIYEEDFKWLEKKGELWGPREALLKKDYLSREAKGLFLRRPLDGISPAGHILSLFKICPDLYKDKKHEQANLFLKVISEFVQEANDDSSYDFDLSFENFSFYLKNESLFSSFFVFASPKKLNIVKFFILSALSDCLNMKEEKDINEYDNKMSGDDYTFIKKFFNNKNIRFIISLINNFYKPDGLYGFDQNKCFIPERFIFYLYKLFDLFPENNIEPVKVNSHSLDQLRKSIKAFYPAQSETNAINNQNSDSSSEINLDENHILNICKNIPKSLNRLSIKKTIINLIRVEEENNLFKIIALLFYFFSRSHNSKKDDFFSLIKNLNLYQNYRNSILSFYSNLFKDEIISFLYPINKNPIDYDTAGIDFKNKDLSFERKESWPPDLQNFFKKFIKPDFKFNWSVYYNPIKNQEDYINQAIIEARLAYSISEIWMKHECQTMGDLLLIMTLSFYYFDDLKDRNSAPFYSALKQAVFLIPNHYHAYGNLEKLIEDLLWLSFDCLNKNIFNKESHEKNSSFDSICVYDYLALFLFLSLIKSNKAISDIHKNHMLNGRILSIEEEKLFDHLDETKSVMSYYDNKESESSTKPPEAFKERFDEFCSLINALPSGAPIKKEDLFILNSLSHLAPTSVAKMQAKKEKSLLFFEKLSTLLVAMCFSSNKDYQDCGRQILKKFIMDWYSLPNNNQYFQNFSNQFFDDKEQEIEKIFYADSENNIFQNEKRCECIFKVLFLLYSFKKAIKLPSEINEHELKKMKFIIHFLNECKNAKEKKIDEVGSNLLFYGAWNLLKIMGLEKNIQNHCEQYIKNFLFLGMFPFSDRWPTYSLEEERNFYFFYSFKEAQRIEKYIPYLDLILSFFEENSNVSESNPSSFKKIEFLQALSIVSEKVKDSLSYKQENISFFAGLDFDINPIISLSKKKKPYLFFIYCLTLNEQPLSASFKKPLTKIISILKDEQFQEKHQQFYQVLISQRKKLVQLDAKQEKEGNQILLAPNDEIEAVEETIYSLGNSLNDKLKKLEKTSSCIIG